MASYFSQDTTVIFQFNLKEKCNNLKLDRLKFVWKIPFPSIPKNKYIYIYGGTDRSFKARSWIVTTCGPVKCKLDAIFSGALINSPWLRQAFFTRRTVIGLLVYFHVTEIKSRWNIYSMRINFPREMHSIIRLNLTPSVYIYIYIPPQLHLNIRTIHKRKNVFFFFLPRFFLLGIN